MPEEKAKDKKNEGKIILETRMRCVECRYKVYKSIVGYPGVEDVSINLTENKVTLKAPKVDAKKLFDSVKKKSGGIVTKLLYPDPTDIKPIKENIKKKKEPKEVTVVLKVSMDCCSSCTRKVEKAAWKISEVQSVKIEGNNLTVKGLDLDPKKVCKTILKKSGKFAEVVPPKKSNDGTKDDNVKIENKQNPQMFTQYVYAPTYFSEENANACVLL